MRVVFRLTEAEMAARSLVTEHDDSVLDLLLAEEAELLHHTAFKAPGGDGLALVTAVDLEGPDGTYLYTLAGDER